MSEDLARDEIEVPKPDAADERLYSVTTIIKAASNNEALIYWAVEETAKAGVGSLKTLHAIIEEQGPEQAIEWLKGARFRRPKGQRTAAELGTAVHRACEEYALTGEKPVVDSELQPFLAQFDGWCQRFQPVYEAAEMTVYHPEFGYAGTADAFLAVDGVAFIGDYKTTRKSLDAKGNPTTPYSEVALQLAALRHAQFAAAWRVRRWESFRRRYYLIGPDERAMAVAVPKVDAGLAIHITPEHCNAHVVRCDEEIFDAFLYRLEDARFNLETSKSVIGDVLQAPVMA